MTKRILIVDDDESIRKSFVLAPEDTGYVITAFCDQYFKELRRAGDEGVAFELMMRKEGRSP